MQLVLLQPTAIPDFGYLQANWHFGGSQRMPGYAGRGRYGHHVGTVQNVGFWNKKRFLKKESVLMASSRNGGMCTFLHLGKEKALGFIKKHFVNTVEHIKIHVGIGVGGKDPIDPA